MTFTLPYPPAVNNLYFTSKTGKRVLSTRGRDYKEEAGWTAKKHGVRPLSGDVAVTLDIYRPRKIGDLDGAMKVVLDSLSGIAYNDDRQVTRITARRFDDNLNPRVEITVEPIGGGE